MWNVKSVLGISLIALSVAVLPACQKAKMTSVKKDESNDRDAERARPRVNRPDPDSNGENNGGRINLPPASDNPSRPTRVGETGDETRRPPQVAVGPATVPRQTGPNRVVIPPRTDGSHYDFDENDEQPVRFLYGGKTKWDPSQCSAECVTPPPTRPRPRPELPEEKICQPIRQPMEPITNKLDVMFVVDTSDSIDSEREKITNEMDKFITELSSVFRKKGVTQSIDLRMAVMLAHGPRTETKSSDDGETVFGRPYVNVREEGAPKAIINVKLNPDQTELDRVKTIIKYRFNGTASGKFDEGTCIEGAGPMVDKFCIRDKSDTQGEAGLLALENFLLHRSGDYAPGNTSDDQVFPRDHAAFMVVFVSNENDVCFDYAKFNSWGNNGKGRTRHFPKSQYLWNDQNDFYGFKNAKSPNPNPQLGEFPKGSGIFRDIFEHKSFVDPEVCAEGTKGQYKHIVDLLQETKPWQEEKLHKLPIIAGGILYPSQEDADKAAFADHAAYENGDQLLKWFADKELGLGYLNVIQELKGKVKSIRAQSFGSQLAEFAQDATIQMIYQVELPLMVFNENTKRWVHLDTNRVDLSSLRVEAFNPGSSEAIKLLRKTDDARNHWRFEPPKDGKHAYIRLHTDALEAADVLPGALMRIYYREKR